VQRQLRRCSANGTSRHHTDSGHRRRGARVADSIPTEAPHRIVHGDYRLDNVILDRRTARIRAGVGLGVVHDGRPDSRPWVCWRCNRLTATRQPTRDTGGGVASLAAGFPGHGTKLLETIARRPDATSPTSTYFSHGYWKLAIILQGV